MMTDTLTDQQLHRYSRQMILDCFPDDGQETLLAARVLVVGLGGLGAQAANLLARAGVGYLGLVDPDIVDLSNLHRQLLFDEEDIGRPKASVVAEKLSYANSEVSTQVYLGAIDAVPAQHWHLVLDCCDDYAARRAVADYAQRIHAPVITASAQGLGGHITTLLPDTFPYFEDVYPKPSQTPSAAISQCEQIGVLGPSVAMMSALIAQESLKHLLSIGRRTHGRLVLWDGLEIRYQSIDF